jgi:V-type H+-transporting ATPase subunit a
MMMGAMAIFTGLLYNEFFAIPNNWFGTCFDISTRCTSEDTECNPSYFPKGCEDPAQGCEITYVYPFGIDPAWYLSPNLLTFTNNIKMKLAVIIGVIHMTIGVLVKGANSIYFRNNLDLVFEVGTGLIILLGLFGWMDLLIFSKWTYVMNPYSVDPAM